jgi:hypothetical protein
MSQVTFDKLSGATLLQVDSKKHGTYNVLIDADDAERVSKHTWHVLRASSARIDFATDVQKPNGKQAKLYLHRFLKQCPDGFDVDHIHHNYLDLRKSELRIVTRQQNSQNMRSHRNTTSRFKGVHWHKQKSKWQALIGHNYKNVHLGYFPSERDAALAYDAKAIELFGEFAKLNIIQERAA